MRIKGYEATMDSWESFGHWCNMLNAGRDELPETLKHEGATDDFEKINILYKYLRKNQRYISIQLGIGGWRSMKAADVAAMFFGDCKGLSLLMKSLLREVGIPSDYTLVLAGDDRNPLMWIFPPISLTMLYCVFHFPERPFGWNVPPIPCLPDINCRKKYLKQTCIGNLHRDPRKIWSR